MIAERGSTTGRFGQWMERLRDFVRGDEYYLVGDSPRYRAGQRAVVRASARVAMLAVAVGAVPGAVVLVLLHPSLARGIVLLHGTMLMLSLAAYASLGRWLRRRPEIVVFVESFVVAGTFIGLGSLRPSMVALAGTYLALLPPSVALFIPWRTWSHAVWLLAYALVADAFFVLAPGGALTLMERRDLVVAMEIALLTSFTGHVLVTRASVRAFVQRTRMRELRMDAETQRMELARVSQSLEEAARTDELTGAGNRLRLQEELETARAAIAERGASFGILILDVDRFKAVNDQRGHLAGDDVLRAIASVIRAATRPGDVVCRYGGEEFVVIGPMSGNGPALVAERIRGAVSSLELTHEANPPHGRVTVSVGAALIGPRDLRATDDDWLGSADAALYRAKRAGRNRVVVTPRPPEDASEAAAADRKGRQQSA